MNGKKLTVIIATADNDEAMGRFYTEILGFQKNEWGGYKLDNLEIGFDRHSKAAKQNPEPFRHMITIEVGDIEAAYRELQGKGVKFVRNIESEEWGGKFATFTDPDGNYLQIFQAP